MDKTAPTGSIAINNNATYTNSTSVTLTLSADDATSGAAHMRFSNDNITWTSWEPCSPSKAWVLTTSDGMKTVYVRFMDNAGLVSLSYQETIILDTTSPIADAGADQSFNEDAVVALDGSASFDENSIASYEWTFTDATPKTLTGANPTYTFANPGTYTITLEVTDLAGNSATDIVIITVLDITKPTANADQDQTVNVGATVTFDAGGSSDNVGIVSYEWDFGDGTSKASVTASHTYTSPGTYTVTLTVKDTAGNADTASITITVLSAEAPLMWIVGAVVATIAIATVLMAVLLRRKHPSTK